MVAGSDREGDGTCERSRYVGRVIRLRPFATGTRVLYRAVPDRHNAGLAVQPAEHGTKTPFVRLPDGIQGQVQGHAGPNATSTSSPGAKP